MVDDVLDRLRLFKSPAEITLLERSPQIIEQTSPSSSRRSTSACRAWI